LSNIIKSLIIRLRIAQRRIKELEFERDALKAIVKTIGDPSISSKYWKLQDGASKHWKQQLKQFPIDLDGDFLEALSTPSLLTSPSIEVTKIKVGEVVTFDVTGHIPPPPLKTIKVDFVIEDGYSGKDLKEAAGALTPKELNKLTDDLTALGFKPGEVQKLPIIDPPADKGYNDDNDEG
jgi:hypothetical protein